MRRQGEKMSDQVIRDASFMQKRARMRGAEYAILDCFPDPLHLRKTLLNSADFPLNYKQISLHAFRACMHSKFAGKEALKVVFNCTHMDTILNPTSTILDQYRKRREGRATRHRSAKTLLLDYAGKPCNMKHACYRALLDT